jgi:sugar phosphate isomerase/epimerase
MMQNQVCVSSYSVGQLLGPIRITHRGPDGKKAPVTWGQGEPTITLLELPAQIKAKLGLDSIEICQFHVPENTPPYLGQLKRALDDAGMSLVNMPIDVGNIADPNPDYRDEDLAEIEGWMRAAATLGARMVRVNAGSPLGGAEVPVDVTVASLRRLARTADSLGLQLLIENHGGRSSDPNFLIGLLEDVGPSLKALLDIGNFEPLMSVNMARFQGKEPPKVIDLTPQYDAIAKVAPFAGLVHAKTHEFDANGRPTDLDVVRALRIVRGRGYSGPISIEYEGRGGDCWENSQRTKALIEEAFA